MPSVMAGKVYADKDLTLAERFTELAERMASGDTAAAHLAVQIANECDSVSSLSPGTPPIGHDKATPYQEGVLEQARHDCAAALSSPEFARVKVVLSQHPVSVFDAPIKQAIREQFADAGSGAALDAAVSALRARPDGVTARVVAQELSHLDVSLFLDMQGQFQSVVSMNPTVREKVIRVAFELLSCDYGNPCGPNSFVVRSACFGMGICMPGTDLQTLYEQELLSGQERRDVLKLLNYLRQIQPSMVARWQ
ncbi:MAG: hypothetical protein WBW92_13580 [Rhodanobacteraceae bacterium]